MIGLNGEQAEMRESVDQFWRDRESEIEGSADGFGLEPIIEMMRGNKRGRGRNSFLDLDGMKDKMSEMRAS